MPVTIKTVESRKDLRAFVKFPLKLYKDCPYYVPSIFIDEMSSLDMDKNPMGKYAKCEKYLAYNEKGEIVGRVAAIINEIANRDWNHAEVRFGWMDFIDGKEVSKALVEAVIAFGKKHGMTQVSGQTTKEGFNQEILRLENLALEGLPGTCSSPTVLNAYTEYIYQESVRSCKALEEKYWLQFGLGF